MIRIGRVGVALSLSHSLTECRSRRTHAAPLLSARRCPARDRTGRERESVDTQSGGDGTDSEGGREGTGRHRDGRCGAAGDPDLQLQRDRPGRSDPRVPHDVPETTCGGLR